MTTTVDARARRSRDRIMNALAELAAEQGVAGFSVQEVADRAGVSHRTIYRHYETREALLDGYARWLDERLGDDDRYPEQVAPDASIVELDGSEAIPSSVSEVFARFDDNAALIEALVMVSLGTGTRLARRDERTDEFRAVLQRDGLVDHLDPADADAVVALIRTLASSNTWFVFRNERDVEGPRAARVVAWGLRTLLAELRRGGGPGIDPTEH